MRAEFETENYKFFCHEKCECFPCHEVSDLEKFNCIFCFCPLYALKKECGGDFVYTEKGIKDCSNCTIPHNPGGYDRIIEKYKKVVAMTKEK
ncbi:MAG: cysteine-rich small domain-containing protein [Anaerovoracaceae bacterium]